MERQKSSRVCGVFKIFQALLVSYQFEIKSLKLEELKAVISGV
jgi:hypothetical protein